jgi:hypothetical protein
MVSSSFAPSQHRPDLAYNVSMVASEYVAAVAMHAAVIIIRGGYAGQLQTGHKTSG